MSDGKVQGLGRVVSETSLDCNDEDAAGCAATNGWKTLLSSSQSDRSSAMPQNTYTSKASEFLYHRYVEEVINAQKIYELRPKAGLSRSSQNRESARQARGDSVPAGKTAAYSLTCIATQAEMPMMSRPSESLNDWCSPGLRCIQEQRRSPMLFQRP